MHYRIIHEDASGFRTWIVILDTGDEAIACLERFAADERVTAAGITAIGAFRRAVLGYFDFDVKDYLRNEIDEQVEVVSAIGDIALGPDGKAAIHVHAVLGALDARVLGGHLLEGHVRPTLEATIVESPAHLHRRHDDGTGLALIRFENEENDR